jgi:hypothetical protein
MCVDVMWAKLKRLDSLDDGSGVDLCSSHEFSSFTRSGYAGNSERFDLGAKSLGADDLRDGGMKTTLNTR